MADVTSDGIPDLINIENLDVSVRPGQGDGTFGDPVYSGPLYGAQLALADFNGDSRLDIFTTYLDSPSDGSDVVTSFGSLLLGRGNGTFEWKQSIGLGLDNTWSFVVGDISGDGRPDVAVAGIDSLGNYAVRDLLNDGYWNWGPYVFFRDATVTEGNTGTSNANFTLTLAHASNVDITFHYHTEDGTATAGSDYQAAFGTLTIPAGQTAGTITVQVNGDSIPEPREAFYVDLSSPTNPDIILGVGQGTIVDDEPHINISIGNATVKEGNTGDTTATFKVTLDAAGTQPIAVSYATSDGTAIAGSDYLATSGMLTFATGETSITITVQVIGDRLAEPNETFSVNLSSPTNATIADSQGVGTIVDDEPRISISDVSKKEGKKGQTTSFIFTVTLSAAYDQPVTMSYRTADGTAQTSDNDYVAKTGTITFNPGETTKTITIVVNGDSKKEADETFYLDLFGNGSNSLFTKSRGTGTILNDD